MVLYWGVFTTIITFLIYGIDKRKAVKHQRRISESFLLTLAFLGGTIGAITGMLVFRHKISKKSFLVKFGLTVMIQIILVCFYLNYSSISAKL